MMKGRWVKVELTKAFPNIIRKRGADLDGNGKIEGNERLTAFNIDAFKKYYLKNRTAIEKRVDFFRYAAALDPKNMKVDNPLHDLISVESEMIPSYEVKLAYLFLKQALKHSRLASARKGRTTAPQRMGIVIGQLRKNLRVTGSNGMLSKSLVAKRVDPEIFGYAVIGLAYQMGLPSKHSTAASRKKFISRIIYRRAIAKGAAGKRAAAFADLSKAISVDPKNADAYLRRGVHLLSMRKYRAAIKDFTKARAHNPKSTAALLYRADVKRKLGDTAGATKDLKTAITTDPPTFIKILLRKMANGQLKAALAECSHIIKIAPKQVEFYMLRANIHVGLKKRKEALADCAMAVKTEPRSAPVRYDSAKIRSGLKDFKGALSDLDAAIKLDPKFIAAHLERANILLAMKRTKAAIAELKRTIKLYPKDVRAHLFLGQMRFQQKKYGKAIAHYSAALLIKPHHAAALYGRARAKARKRDFKGAEADLSTIIARNPRSVHALYRRGLIRVHLTQYAGAISDFKKIAKLMPGNKQIQLLIKRIQKKLRLSR